MAVVQWEQPPDPSMPAPLRRVTGVKLQVTVHDLVRRELAPTRGQEATPVTATEFPGFVVDRGFGALPFSRRLQDEWSELEAITDRVRDSSGRIDCLAIDLELLSRVEAAEQ